MKKNPFSKLISGTMHWGQRGKELNTFQMIELMETCIENQITTFDHADIYGGYTVEADFGNAFAESKINRESIQLISKCGIQHLSRPQNKIGHYDYSKNHIIQSAENSLKNLKTDYLDLLLLHRPSPLMQADEIAEAVFQLKNKGKILDFGVSNFTPSQCDLIETKTKISYNQIQFSATHLDPMLNGSLDHMQIKKIKPMSWSPLGSVFKLYVPQSERVKIAALEMAEKYNVTIDIILIAWILKHPAGILPVFGTIDKTRISKIMQATTLEMDLQDWFVLWVESAGNRVP